MTKYNEEGEEERTHGKSGREGPVKNDGQFYFELVEKDTLWTRLGRVTGEGEDENHRRHRNHSGTCVGKI